MHSRAGSHFKVSCLVKITLISLVTTWPYVHYTNFSFILLERVWTRSISSINSFAQKRASLYPAAGFSLAASPKARGKQPHSTSTLNFPPRVIGDFPPSIGDVPVDDSQPFIEWTHGSSRSSVRKKPSGINSLMKPSLKMSRDHWTKMQLQLKHHAHPIRFSRMMEMEILKFKFLDTVKSHFNLCCSHSPSRSEDPWEGETCRRWSLIRIFSL